MRVSRFMQTNVITIPSDTFITDAQRIMQENNVRRLPVVDKGKLAGIITRTRLRDAAPSVATSLNTWELHYLLSKITVRDVMERNVLTTGPDVAIEEAAAIMAENRIGAMPVMDDGRLVGIITATDLFRLLVNVLGVRQPGARVHIKEPYKDKPFGAVSQVFAQHHVRIMSAFTFTDPQTQSQDMVIRADTEDAAFIAKVMRENGFEVVEED